MESPLGPSLANAFSAYHRQNYLDSCLFEYRPLDYRQYVEHISTLCKWSDQLKRFQSYLNLESCYVNKPFTAETEQNNKI